MTSHKNTNVALRKHITKIVTKIITLIKKNLKIPKG